MKGKVVVITGASKGIGAELARQLAARGAKLVLAARDLKDLETVAAQCTQAGGSAIVVRADVGVERDCAAIMSGAALAYGGIDVMVNNAGATMWGRFEEIEDVSVLDRIMRVNYMGAVYCTKHALPYLRQSRGLLVGIASLTALTGVPTRSGYAASKHAMRGFFDSLRIELMGSGVDVTMIYPGFVATGIRENAIGPGGKPQAIDPIDPRKAMSVEECARITLAAIEARKREVVMTARGKMGVWLKLVSPTLVDRIAKRVIEREADRMDPAVWITYLVATFILSLSPGPGAFSSMSSGLHHGFRLGMWNGIGMQAANLLMVVLVSLGLGALLLASETLFTLVKWAGVAYLVYLGIATWRAPAHGFEEDRHDGETTARGIFMRGFWVNATNPKGIIFFAAVLPQFIDTARPQLAQYAILAATTFAVDVVVMMGYTAFAAKVLGAMRDPAKLRWVNRTLGGMFIAAGVALASFRRTAHI